ncbi:MAG: P-loop NTPase fold protein [Actinomycetota bacterium]
MAELQINTDKATEHDELGRAEYVDLLADVIGSRRTETPLVVAIYGTWGSGKTSLMKQLRRRLDPEHDAVERSTGSGVRTIWFDPWMHQFDDYPALGLLHTTADQLGIMNREVVTSALLKLAVAVAEDIQLPVIGVRVGKLLKIRDEISNDALVRRDERTKVRNYFADIIDQAKDGHDRLVFFIDDLDRCQPKVALSMLESMKLYLDFPGCVFVVGVDREPLEAAVESEYRTLGLNSGSYLDKIVQLPFAIPAIDRSAMRTFVEAKLPADLDESATILALAAADDPRNVKRLANMVAISHELALKRLDPVEYLPRVLTLILVIQAQAPSLYTQLRLDPSLIHELREPGLPEGDSDEISSGDPESLWEVYLRPRPRLQAAVEAAELPADLDATPYLTLTAITASPDAAPPTTSRGQVYLNYRRDDTGKEMTLLRSELGPLGWTVVADRKLSTGSKVAEETEREIRSSAAMVVLIGESWAELRHPQGGRRIDYPADIVASEIRIALDVGVPILVVLVGDALLPEMPPSLAALRDLQFVRMDPAELGPGIAQIDRFLEFSSTAS